MKIKITKTDKEYIWKKIEYVKKKKAILEKNELYNLLNNPDILEYSKDDLMLIYNSLEYVFKQKIKGLSKEIDKFEFYQVKKIFSILNEPN
jgi:hypothetical protein